MHEFNHLYCSIYQRSSLHLYILMSSRPCVRAFKGPSALRFSDAHLFSLYLAPNANFHRVQCVPFKNTDTYPPLLPSLSVSFFALRGELMVQLRHSKRDVFLKARRGERNKSWGRADCLNSSLHNPHNHHVKSFRAAGYFSMWADNTRQKSCFSTSS